MEGINNKDKLWISLMKLGHLTGCHQCQERSFFYKGYQFPVCARCTGALLGEILAYLVALLGIVCSPILCFVLIVAMGIDWLVQYIGVVDSTNIRRLVTGLMGGFGLTMLVLKFIKWSTKIVLKR